MPTVRSYQSIRDVPPSVWDLLSDEHDINYSRGYLGFREATEPGASVVLVLYDDDERALAGVAAYVTTDETPFFNHPLRLLTSTQVLREGGSGLGTAPPIPASTLRAFEARMPTLVVTNLGDSRILTRPGLGPDQRRSALAEMLAAIGRQARELGCRSTAFLYARGDDPDLVAAMNEQRFRIAMCSSRADIDLSGVESRDQYMAALPRSKRRAMEREIRQFVDNPLTIRELDPPERYLDRIAALELQTYARHGVTLVAEEVRERLRRQLEHTGRTTRLMGCFEGTRLVAAAVDLVGRSQYFCTTYGQDHQSESRRYTYQMMSFYDPIERACRSDLRAVYLGIEALQAKLRRGAVATPLYVALSTVEEAPEVDRWLDRVDDRNRRYLLEMTERFGTQDASWSKTWLPSPAGRR